MTNIEWTEKTWNPIVGCTVKSKGCTNCYAMKMAARLERMNETTGNTPQYANTTKKVNGKTVWTGTIGIAPDSVWEQPLRRKKPTMYFVNSMGDLFHPNVPNHAIDRAFAVMALSPQHTFQVLTKHPERMRDWSKKLGGLVAAIMKLRRSELAISSGMGPSIIGPLPHLAPGSKWFPITNVWLGTSIEDQPTANERIPFLLDTPAAVRFVSAEPLLGGVDLDGIKVSKELEALQGYDDDGEQYKFNALSADDFYSLMDGDDAVDCVEGEMRPALDWVIVGGESGPDARPMHPDWARSIRDQCAEAGVPFFFKQWGEWAPTECGFIDEISYPLETGVSFFGLPSGTPFIESAGWAFVRTGKKAAGRTLDGHTHDGMPA